MDDNDRERTRSGRREQDGLNYAFCLVFRRNRTLLFPKNQSAQRVLFIGEDGQGKKMVERESARLNAQWRAVTPFETSIICLERLPAGTKISHTCLVFLECAAISDLLVGPN
jgi:hypothetical protein